MTVDAGTDMREPHIRQQCRLQSAAAHRSCHTPRYVRSACRHPACVRRSAVARPNRNPERGCTCPRLYVTGDMHARHAVATPVRVPLGTESVRRGLSPILWRTDSCRHQRYLHKPAVVRQGARSRGHQPSCRGLSPKCVVGSTGTISASSTLRGLVHLSRGQLTVTETAWRVT